MCAIGPRRPARHKALKEMAEAFAAESLDWVALKGAAVNAAYL